MQIEKVKISQVKNNPNNPRVIKNDDFRKLVKSIKEAPWMLQLRSIIVNDDNIVLGGNQRLRACKEAGLKEVYIIKASSLTEEQQREFIIKDNLSSGEWDWDALANEFDAEDLNRYGLDLPIDEDPMDEKYTSKVGSPVYETKGVKPSLNSLLNIDKTKALLSEIEQSDAADDIKDFLTYAAYRHIVFDYQLIAEYYAHADKSIQSLMEKSALVVIDYNQAIENGYVELTKTLQDLYEEDYG